jgi:hypothetical protein
MLDSVQATEEMTAPIELFGVYDRAVGGKERIVLRVNEWVSLARYAIVLGVPAAEGGILPFRDSFYWLGAREMRVPGWVFVYTGSGNEGTGKESATGDPVQALYWGRPQVVFTSSLVLPALIEISGADIWTRDRGVGEIEAPSRNALRGIIRSAMPPNIE